jgi:hypothetical protein
MELYGIKKHKELLLAINVNILKIYNYMIYFIDVIVDVDTIYADFAHYKIVILHI